MSIYPSAVFAAVLSLLAASCSSGPKHVEIPTAQGTMRLIPMADNAIRVKVHDKDTHQIADLIYLDSIADVDVKVKRDGNNVTMTLKGISATYNADTDQLVFYDAAGNEILAEKPGSRIMQESTVQGEPTYSVSATFLSPADEHLYGTGQFQDGYLDIRGLSRLLTQVNTQISVPVILSNKGYGLIWNNHGLTDYNAPTENVQLASDGQDGKSVTVNVSGGRGNVQETRQDNVFVGDIDVPQAGQYSILMNVGRRMGSKHKVIIDDSVYVDFSNLWLPPTASFKADLNQGTHKVRVEGVNGDKPSIGWRLDDGTTSWHSPVAQNLDYTVIAGNADEAIATYRDMTGQTPMMPIWALGYIHCRERYDTQADLLDNAMQFRQKEIPIDVIVQDWQYWGKNGWNAMKFDTDKYPDPKLMVDSLHANDMRLMISVWSKVDANSEVGKKATEGGYYIPGSDWIDFFNPEAARFYWSNFSDGLLRPYGIDAWWQDATEPENDDLQGRRIAAGALPGEVYRNAFPILVNRTVYEGLRNDNPDRRAMILTRSGFPGIQRYAAATWSGDVGHDWETLRRQIAGGLGQMATGLPWWTYDAGGFFRPQDQYDSEDYHEVYVRWLQTATFLPLMRTHGYMSNTEPWRYGELVDSLSRKYIALRYSLLPYIYSNAAEVALSGSTLMRPLVFDFPDDNEALARESQYMFGRSLLVAPVLQPGIDSWDVYLPAAAGWTDFWTGERHNGGTVVKADAPIDKIPLFVKDGSIIPMTSGLQSTADYGSAPIELHVYPGADGTFVLYEDEGDNYNYEKGEYATIPLRWDDKESALTIGSRKGTFSGMQTVHDFVVVLPDGTAKPVKYDGKEVTVKL